MQHILHARLLRSWCTRLFSSDRIIIVFSVFGTILIVFRFFYHVFSGSNTYVTLVEDDALYYIVTAKHIVNSGLSTFDGYTLTNGYHPLWMCVIVSLVYLFGSGATLFAAIGVVCGLCFFLTGIWTDNLSRLLFERSILRVPMVLIALYFSLRLICEGMEVTILLPLLLYTVIFVITHEGSKNTKDTVVSGVLCSAVILARLDAVLFVVQLLLLVVMRSSVTVAARIRTAAWLLFGLLPLAVFLCWNRYTYGTFATVSSLAKQQVLQFSVNWRYLYDLWETPEGKVGSFLIIPALLLLVCSARLRSRYRSRPEILLLLLLPCILSAVVMLRSSWVLFPWYLYSLPLAMLCAGMVCSDWLFE